MLFYSAAMCRAPSGTLGVRLSEARLLSLRRLLASPQAAQKQSHGGLRQQPFTSDTSSRRGGHTPDQAASAAQQAVRASQADRQPRLHVAPVVLQNLCGLDLQFGQIGTAESIAIADGVSMPYR